VRAAAHRYLGRGLAALLLGFALVGLLFETAIALGLAIAFGMLAITADVLFWHREDHLERSRLAPLRLAAAAAGAGPVVAGLVLVFGSAAGPLALLGLVLAGGLLRHRIRGRPPAGAAAEPVPDGSGDHLTDLSDAELGRAWRHSYTRVVHAQNARELGRLSALRRQQLDEIERRDPAGFRRWFAGGGYVTGDSPPFLSG
jgi:hypothetical protein